MNYSELTEEIGNEFGKDYLHLADVAYYLGMSVGSIRNAISIGTFPIPSFKDCSGRRKIAVTELARYMIEVQK